MTDAGITVHPAAELFPKKTVDELRPLVEDVRRNGLRRPIQLYQGKILLDGRDRLTACLIAGVPPKYIDADLNGTLPTLFVVSQNPQHQQLNPAQRAAIAAELMPIIRQESLEHRHHPTPGGGNGQPKSGIPAEPAEAPPETNTRGNCRDIAGKAMGVSATSVQIALAIKKKDGALFAKLRNGEITVQAARRELQPDKYRLPRRPGKINQRRINAAKQTLVDILSRIGGLCRGLSGLDVSLATPGLTREEHRTWVAMSLKTSRQLRDFACRLKEAK